MNFLQSISSIRENSMTFQREKEQITQKSKQHSPATTIRDNQHTTEMIGKVNENQQEDIAETFEIDRLNLSKKRGMLSVRIL